MVDGLSRCRRWQKANRGAHNANRRRHYHRHKKLGGVGEWTRANTAELLARRARGESQSKIAKAMGISVSTVAGKLSRLRKSAAASGRPAVGASAGPAVE